MIDITRYFSKIFSLKAFVAILGVAGTFCLVATQSVAAETELDAFKSAIRAKYDMKEAAFAANDPEPILTRFYSEDVISTGPDGVTHIGREALAPVYDEVIGSNVMIESFDSYVAGDAGWDWVNFNVSFPPGVEEEPFTFKMLFLWQRIDGEWWSRGEMYVMGKFDVDGQQGEH